MAKTQARKGKKTKPPTTARAVECVIEGLAQDTDDSGDPMTPANFLKAIRDNCDPKYVKMVLDVPLATLLQKLTLRQCIEIAEMADVLSTKPPTPEPEPVPTAAT